MNNKTLSSSIYMRIVSKICLKQLGFYNFSEFTSCCLFYSKCIIIHHFSGCYKLILFQTRINQVLKAYTKQDGVVNRGRDDYYTNS